MMLITDARRDARFENDELVLLPDQDRSRWNEAQIARGREMLDLALALRGRGSYVLQAAIAALHTDDPLDWTEIAALYAELARLTGSPVVEVNRGIAVAEADEPAAGLALLEKLDLDGHQYFHSTRAGSCVGWTDSTRLGRHSSEYELAAAEPERRFLRGRIRRSAAPPPPRHSAVPSRLPFVVLLNGCDKGDTHARAQEDCGGRCDRKGRSPYCRGTRSGRPRRRPDVPIDRGGRGHR